MNKTVKNKEKEIHNLSKHLENLKSEVSNLRCKQSKLENQIKRSEKQQKKKQYIASVFTQTNDFVDTPYSITEALPPIFGSKLCVQTKPGFFTKSLPNLSSIVTVADTEEELILEAAENALCLQTKSCFLDDDGFKCKTCGLSFKSQQELLEHDSAYTNCCRECLICFKTLQESQNHLC